jgi:hypothetical protein
LPFARAFGKRRPGAETLVAENKSTQLLKQEPVKINREVVLHFAKTSSSPSPVVCVRIPRLTEQFADLASVQSLVVKIILTGCLRNSFASCRNAARLLFIHCVLDQRRMILDTDLGSL